MIFKHCGSVEPIVPIHNLISKNTCYSNAVFFCNFALTGERNKLLVAKIGERERKKEGKIALFFLRFT